MKVIGVFYEAESAGMESFSTSLTTQLLLGSGDEGPLEEGRWDW